MNYLNIGIIGENNCGKKTFANIINTSDFFDDTNLKLNIKIINFDYNFDDIANENLDLYFVISNNGLLGYDNEQRKKLDAIKNIICNNNYGVLFILHNIFLDDHDMFDDNLDSYTSNIYAINFYTLFLHKILYNYKDCDILEDKTKNDITKLVKSIIGEMEYKKNKNNLENIKDIQNYLKKKNYDEEIYNNAMCDFGYDKLRQDINFIINDNLDLFLEKHIELKTEELKYSSDLMLVLFELNSIMNLILSRNMKKDVYHKFEYLINDNIKNLLKYYEQNPMEITNNIIEKLEETDILICNITGNNNLFENIAILKNLKKENLVHIFEKKFDAKLMEEINGKMTCEILRKSLENTITSEYSFEAYLSIIDDVSILMNNDINYIATVCVFFNKYITHNQKIAKYKLNKIIANEKDKKIEFVFWKIYDSIKKFTPNDNDTTYDDFDKCNIVINKFYNIVKNTFISPTTIDKIVEYFCDDYLYDFSILALKNIANKFLVDSNIKKVFAKMKELHDEDKLDDLVLDEKNVIMNKINIPQKYNKIHKFVDEKFIMSGNKNLSLEINVIYNKFIKWYNSNHKSKISIVKNDIVDFLKCYGDILEINDNIVFGIDFISANNVSEKSVSNLEIEESESEEETPKRNKKSCLIVKK